MTTKGAAIISGVTGFILGGLLTYLYLKSDSEKSEVYVPKEEREKKEAAPDKEPTLERSDISKDENLDDPTLKYIKAVREKSYSQSYNESVELPKDEVKDEKPYVISPEQCQELPGYNFFTLKYFNDGYLVDESGEQLDDPENVVGNEFMNHFDEYEEDTVYIRNDRLQSDFMIVHLGVNYSDTIV